jgi:hypothetical protein
VYDRIAPLANSRLIIDNIFDPDLPEELWGGDEITQSIARAGRKLDALNVLPAPFPIDEILSERDRRHLKRLYGLGGLSYGNISARFDEGPLLDERLGRRQVEPAGGRQGFPDGEGLRPGT